MMEGSPGRRSATEVAIWAPVLLLLAWIYVPFVRHGGLLLDDWSVWLGGVSASGYVDAYRGWFPLFSIRPLAPVVLAFTGRTFAGHAWAYILLHLGLLFTALSVAARSWRSLPTSTRAVFVAVAALPAAASTAVLSPGMQVQASTSLLLWSIGDRLLGQSASGTLRRRVSGYLLFLCAMLVYEIVLPLFALTFLRLWCVERVGKRRLLWSASGIASVVLAVAVYQKIIVPRFTVSYSRLNVPSVGNAIRAAACWALALLVQTPTLLASALKHVASHGSVSHLDLVVVAVLAAVLGAGVALRPAHDGPAIRGWALAAALSLLSASVLYVGSGQFANATGYDNRGLTSAWILASLLIAILVTWCPARRIAGVVTAVVVFLTSVTLSLERNQQIKASDLQHRILADVVRLAEQQGGGGPRHAQLLGLIPVFLPDNFNDELVFRHPWDFTAALALTSGGRFDGGMVLTTDNWGWAPSLDGSEITAGEARLPVTGTWFYEWGGETGSSRMGPVDGIETAARLIERGRALPQIQAQVAPAQFYTPVLLMLRARNWQASR
jgi:hypothetical protein